MANQPTPSILSTLVTNTGATIATCVVLAAGAILSTDLIANRSASAGASPAATMQAGPAPAVTLVASPAPTPIDPKLVSPEQRKAIEQIMREYLVANPDVLVEAMKEYEVRQQAASAAQAKLAIVEKKSQIFRSPHDVVLGNPNGDITVVEFFDYNCGWCKKAVDEIGKLAKADPKIRIVMKELPIFGGANSQLAAKAAMASISQGKYWEYHQALMKERQVTRDNVFTIAEKVGIDVAKLKAEMASPKIEAAIKDTMALAQTLGIDGTPGFMVDARINPGYMPLEQINEMIADVRKSGGCTVC
jgi:protein-disulfide isomerase